MKLTGARKGSLKLRKNGKRAIDSASTVRVPIGMMNRIIRSNRVAVQWQYPSVASYTPNYVEMILRGALAGDHLAQWQLFDLMLETWPTLSSCQQELLYGITRRDLVFDPYAEEDEKATPNAIEREKLVTSAIRSMNPDAAADENAGDGTIKDIMDGWFRGISVLEIVWQLTDLKIQEQAWTPRATYWVHPSYYAFDENGILGLTLPRAPAGYGTTTATTRPQVTMPFPPNKFLIAIHKAKSGSALGGPMLRSLAWWWCASNFSSDWLLNLAQIFGLPFRWANYAASSPDETISTICDMLQNMGSAGWAAFPEGTTLELKEANRSGSLSPQGDLLDRADAYARMMILGQTLTGQTIASGRGGQSFGTVEAQLKQDRLDAACNFVAGIINRQLIPAILMINYGDAKEAPTCRFLQETEGTYQDSQRDQILAGLGLPIPFTHLQQKYNIPEPTGDEEVTKPPPKPTPFDGSAGPKGTRPTGQPSKLPDEQKKQPKKVEARLQEISLIENDEIFASELRKFAAELVTKESTNDTSQEEN